MKKIEKELLLIDLENANLSVDRKYRKLDTIIVYFLDEEQPQLPKDEPEPKEDEEVKVDEEIKEGKEESDDEPKEESEEPKELDDLDIPSKV